MVYLLGEGHRGISSTYILGQTEEVLVPEEDPCKLLHEGCRGEMRYSHQVAQEASHVLLPKQATIE